MVKALLILVSCATTIVVAGNEDISIKCDYESKKIVQRQSSTNPKTVLLRQRKSRLETKPSLDERISCQKLIGCFRALLCCWCDHKKKE